MGPSRQTPVISVDQWDYGSWNTDGSPRNLAVCLLYICLPVASMLFFEKFQSRIFFTVAVFPSDSPGFFFFFFCFSSSSFFFFYNTRAENTVSMKYQRICTLNSQHSAVGSSAIPETVPCVQPTPTRLVYTDRIALQRFFFFVVGPGV